MIDRESAARAIEEERETIDRLIPDHRRGEATYGFTLGIMRGLRRAAAIIRALPDVIEPPTPCPLDLIDIDGETS